MSAGNGLPLIITLMLGIVTAGMVLYPTPVQATTPITSCANCHGNPPVDSATRNAATKQFPGTHNTHAGAWYTTTDSRYGIQCEVCHRAPNWTSYSHRNGNIDVNLRWMSVAGGVPQGGSVAGWGSYSRGTSIPVANITTVGQVCRNTYCHSNGIGGPTFGRPIENNVSAMWGTNTPGGPGCTPCHGHETGNPGNGAPWYTSAFMTSNWTTAKANSHQAHAPSGTPCFKCHYTTTNTGNTITSVGNHIKMNYSVNPGPGISYTYAYSTTGGTCSTVSCHGGGNMKWGTGTADCVGCHSGSPIPRGLGIGTLRRVVGAGGDFNMGAAPTGSRHLYGATTITKWDCIVCHREGSITNGKASANHNDGVTTTGGKIHLRNVDTTDENIGWTIDNERWTTTDYANLDQFCLSCHDADGASQVAVNASNNGLYTGTAAWNTTRAGWKTMGGTFPGRAAMSPFNSTDWRSGFNGASTQLASAGPGRAKMIDVRSQFAVNNPSHHAVLGQRYTTKNASWLTVAWTSYASKKTTRNLKETGEAALFSCADCHVLDTGGGAHGGERKYNMWASAINNGICQRCHSSTTYQGGGAANGSRYSHNYTRSGTTGYGLPQGSATNPANCLMCHASWNGLTTANRQNSYGGIHGSWTTPSGTASLITAPGYRFFPGTYRRQSMSTTNYNSTTAGGCYFPEVPGSEGFTNCTSHIDTDGSTAVTTPGYSRPVTY